MLILHLFTLLRTIRFMKYHFQSSAYVLPYLQGLIIIYIYMLTNSSMFRPSWREDNKCLSLSSSVQSMSTLILRRRSSFLTSSLDSWGINSHPKPLKKAGISHRPSKWPRKSSSLAAWGGSPLNSSVTTPHRSMSQASSLRCFIWSTRVQASALQLLLPGPNSRTS